MTLHVSFDDKLIKEYVDRGSSPFFTIYWTQEGAAYPEDQWTDFGSVILSWWLVAARSLVGSVAEAEFSFMDGPYSLKIRRVDECLYISAEDSPVAWQVSTEDFTAELFRASEKVQQRFAQLGIPDREGLAISVQKLRTALAQASKSDNQRVLASHA